MIVSFPKLHLSFHVNRIAFTMFGHAIYWYGIIIALACLVAVVFLIFNAKKNDLESEFIVDSFPWLIVCGIVGARLYFVLSNISDYISKPLEIFAIWKGGIAIYGAIIGGAVGLYYFCKKKGIKFLQVLDVYAPSLILGQAIGRWGNFFNGEAYGVETNSKFQMIIKKVGEAPVKAHPTFLYESLACLIGFILLLILPKIFKKFYENKGYVFYTYLIIYGIARFFIEGLRTDSLPYGGNFKISQILSCIIVIFGIVMLFTGFVKKLVAKLYPDEATKKN